MNLTHVRLLVTDMPACFRFYRDVLGLTPKEGNESKTYTAFEAGPATIALFERELMAESVGTLDRPSDVECQDRAALIIATTDVDAVHETLAARGASFVNPPHDRADWGIRCVHLRDPDGNLIEINEDIPPERRRRLLDGAV